jgi:hypothetical protein
VADADEARREKDEDRAEMATEGWLFSPEDNAYIGQQVRRFFSGHGRSDGAVVGYLPPEKNDGLAMWRIEHGDGDEEDLEEADVARGCRAHRDNLQEDDEPPAADAGDEADDEADGGDGDDGGVDDVDDDGDLIFGPPAAGGNGDGAVATLWATAGVRARWLQALQQSRTVAEVALALAAFTDFARGFGVVDEAKDEAYAQVHHTCLDFMEASSGDHSTRVPSLPPGGGGQQGPRGRLVGPPCRCGRRRVRRVAVAVPQEGQPAVVAQALVLLLLVLLFVRRAVRRPRAGAFCWPCVDVCDCGLTFVCVLWGSGRRRARWAATSRGTDELPLAYTTRNGGAVEGGIGRCVS